MARSSPPGLCNVNNLAGNLFPKGPAHIPLLWQLCIFPWVNNFASNSYLQPRFWYYCQNVRPLSTQCRSLSVFNLWHALWYLYLRVSAQRFEPGDFIKLRRFRKKIRKSTHHPYLDDYLCRFWDEIPTTILQRWFVTIPSVMHYGPFASSSRAAESKRRALGNYFSERICYMFLTSKYRRD